MEPSKSSKSRAIRSIVFAVFVLLLIGTLFWLSTSPRVAPEICDEASANGKITMWKNCLECHDKDGIHPTPPEHPINMQRCFRCHHWPTPQKAMK